MRVGHGGPGGGPGPSGTRGPSSPPVSLPGPGKPMYLHMGEEVDGVDMRAEVGLLSRNIVVMGEMEDACYPYTKHVCSFFDFDTFGGHIKVRVCLSEAINRTRRPTPGLWAGFSAGKGTEGRRGETSHALFTGVLSHLSVLGSRRRSQRGDVFLLPGHTAHVTLTPRLHDRSPSHGSHSLSPSLNPGPRLKELVFSTQGTVEP